MCRICYSVDARKTDIGLTGKTKSDTANASIKVCMRILLRYLPIIVFKSASQSSPIILVLKTCFGLQP